MPTDGRVTLAVSGCAGVSQPTCGQCNVSGPIDNRRGRARQPPLSRCHGCNARTTATVPATTCSGGANDDALCTNASECPGGSCSNAGVIGPCTYFFGAPLPLRVGGIPMCVLNEIAGPIAGTVNVDDGTTTTALPLSSRIFVGGTEFAPCPRCESDVCQDGSRFGHACTANGTGQFGAVSFDCPGSSPLFGSQTINLNLATGTQTKTVEVANPTCRQTGFTGLKCLCDTCNDANQESCSTNVDCPFSGGGPGSAADGAASAARRTGNPVTCASAAPITVPIAPTRRHAPAEHARTRESATAVSTTPPLAVPIGMSGAPAASAPAAARATVPVRPHSPTSAATIRVPRDSRAASTSGTAKANASWDLRNWSARSKPSIRALATRIVILRPCARSVSRASIAPTSRGLASQTTASSATW
jgi:hypothetical protein